MVDENSLVNMEVEDLESRGAETGLVIEVKAGRERPEKIEPNQIPTGLKDMINSGIDLIRMISGVSETFQVVRSRGLWYSYSITSTPVCYSVGYSN